MTVPGPGQTVHLLSWRDVLRVQWDMHRWEGRNVREPELYTTDDLRRLYQATNDDPIRLIDGIVSRIQLVAVIRWRISWRGSAMRHCYSCPWSQPLRPSSQPLRAGDKAPTMG
jgi:hypothetical protein